MTLSLSALVFFALGVGMRQGLEMPRFSALGSAADGVDSVLSLIVLLRMGTMRWSAQFLLIPLLAILEGILFLHPAVFAPSWTGGGLLMIGSAFLVFRREQRQTLPLRRLMEP